MEHANKWKGVDKERQGHFLQAANFHANASQSYHNAVDAYKGGDKGGAETSMQEAKENEGAARSLRLKHSLAVKHLDSVSKRSNRPAEHTATITYNGDFNLGEFLRALWILGGWGASRGVQIAPDDEETQSDLEDKGYQTKFGWDGDGADRIVSAEIDGEDILKIAKNDTVDVGTNLTWYDQSSGSRGGDINWNQEDLYDLLPEDDEDVLSTIAELKSLGQ
jgi:hypothetical protein